MQKKLLFIFGAIVVFQLFYFLRKSIMQRRSEKGVSFFSAAQIRTYFVIVLIALLLFFMMT
ncbi:hypothetical protein GN157_12150 [Flavobacterium rakeshii]|uniref:Uncharacterized protein n=2 Tax=Flavobacterium TaxID=237 RepID=A0A0A2LTZ7_9FLAO|nr:MULTISPECIES: hypothetical protein [Flavobacterium]KGO79635.1 hypothetical protein Q763_12350 [Flavobacterium beibuense F44-8]MEE1900178.1 hypothetical protein [Flavobacterium rakeshii]MUV04462.1 hypothetical protein [Flavobacterium rakeshii]